MKEVNFLQKSFSWLKEKWYDIFGDREEFILKNIVILKSNIGVLSSKHNSLVEKIEKTLSDVELNSKALYEENTKYLEDRFDSVRDELMDELNDFDEQKNEIDNDMRNIVERLEKLEKSNTEILKELKKIKSPTATKEKAPKKQTHE